MKTLNVTMAVVLAVALILGGLCSPGWAEQNAIKDEYNIFDLLVARPLAVVAGIAGTAVFILSLPFTIPTHSVDKAAEMFIGDPFRYAFSRDFPDDNIVYDRQ